MGLQDVAFLPSRASFSTTFLKNCGRDDGLWTITYLGTVDGVSKSMRHVRYFCSKIVSFYISWITWRS